MAQFTTKDIAPLDEEYFAIVRMKNGEEGLVRKIVPFDKFYLDTGRYDALRDVRDIAEILGWDDPD